MKMADEISCRVASVATSKSVASLTEAIHLQKITPTQINALKYDQALGETVVEEIFRI